MKICTCALALIFGSSLTAWSQQRTTITVPRTYPIPIPQMEKGTIDGRTYKNPTIGLEFTPPVGMTFGTPELKGTPGTVPLLATVAAWGERRRLSPREGEIFYADALGYYPNEQRLNEAYVRKLVRANRQQGFEPVGNSFDARLGGVSFSRTDFKKTPVYEAVLVKACAAEALVFIFVGSDRDSVSRLISGTSVRYSGSQTGCDLGGSGVKK